MQKMFSNILLALITEILAEKPKILSVFCLFMCAHVREWAADQESVEC